MIKILIGILAYFGGKAMYHITKSYEKMWKDGPHTELGGMIVYFLCGCWVCLSTMLVYKLTDLYCMLCYSAGYMTTLIVGRGESE